MKQFPFLRSSDDNDGVAWYAHSGTEINSLHCISCKTQTLIS